MLKNISRIIIGLNLGLSLSGHAQGMTAVNHDSLHARIVLSGESQEARAQWLRRQIFVDNVLTQSTLILSDTTLLFRMQPQSPLSLNQSQLKALAPRLDPIDEKFRREQLNQPPMSPLGTLIGKGLKYLAGKFGGSPNNPLAIIPSETEVEVMTVLWKKNVATSVEIYANLDSTKLSAADLQQTLEVMTDRGLLDRQQISPRNEFTVLGVIPIEMSAKNRKNREYLYHANVSRQTMLTFLDATTFTYRLAATDNHSLIVDHLHKLMNRLVVQEDD
ncbi:MAG: hypothetical protein ALAOOOJD_03053 [bacterium]|nr:hypothetical protein [bacterium]